MAGSVPDPCMEPRDGAVVAVTEDLKSQTYAV